MAAKNLWPDAPIPDPELETAHDVRNLRGCPECGNIHMKQVMVDLDSEWFHGRCFIRRFGLPALLALPRVKLDRLMLADVGPKVMRRILASLERG